MEHVHASRLDSFPPYDEAELDRLLDREIAADPHKIVVLDDDPTGVQTVHDISVFTDWTPESIEQGFDESVKVFYILTNSRGLTQDETTRIHRDIAARVAAVAARKKRPWLIMSRSDSTLRGHYPLETELLRDEIEKSGVRVDGEILCPFFKEGGRYTLDNVHYVRYGDDLVPAGETEFARDKTFGYTKSNLCDYVEEKTGGRYPARDVICVSLDDLRACAFDKIEKQLLGAHDFQKIVVNAVDYSDVKAFCIPLYRAMARGGHFVFRTAAALVKVLGGISTIPLLTRDQMVGETTGRGGMIVVGSHTRKTTAQLNRLLDLPGVRGIEFNSDLVLESDEALRNEVRRVVAESEKLIEQGITPVCYTKRTLISLATDSGQDALVRSVKISDAVQSLVGGLTVKPAFVIAKGGITSSDVGVKALKVRRANVMGQIRPGIPVWQTDSQSKFPGIPYVIFPGNVGEENTLREAVEILIG
ncbi:MAG: hypothetical protein J1E80_09875 [Desulfovibrionaceae bacterium]|nr:hypothetical protein [Desulfovibrionaceae bacterium]